MTDTQPSGRMAPVVLVLVLVALAVGAAASLLAGAATRGNVAPQQFSELTVQPWLLEAAVLVLVWGGAAWLVYYHVANRTPVPGRIAVTALVGILVAIVLVVVLHNLGLGAGPTSPSTPGHENGTSPGSSSGNGTGLGGSGSLYYLGPALPPWSLFIVISLVAVAIGLVVTMPAWRRAVASVWSRGSRSRVEEEAHRVREALGQAEAALDAGSDPRQVVIQLYATLLARLRPSAGDLDRSTPEEIRAEHLVRLGVRASAAETLTRAFEEARYSSHPISLAMLDRVRAAIRDASDDLDRT